mmetsp:Transcript_70612/g.125120  ORF Transcript_70612/g.125120 Transcript_70612/m.125120 type:complete len:226 (+) Transcript_70612:1082-1759(+)
MSDGRAAAAHRLRYPLLLPSSLHNASTHSKHSLKVQSLQQHPRTSIKLRLCSPLRPLLRPACTQLGWHIPLRGQLIFRTQPVNTSLKQQRLRRNPPHASQELRCGQFRLLARPRTFRDQRAQAGIGAPAPTWTGNVPPALAGLARTPRLARPGLGSRLPQPQRKQQMQLRPPRNRPRALQQPRRALPQQHGLLVTCQADFARLRKEEELELPPPSAVPPLRWRPA